MLHTKLYKAQPLPWQIPIAVRARTTYGTSAASEDFNAFGSDPRGRVANAAALLLGENWRPDQRDIPRYHGPGMQIDHSYIHIPRATCLSGMAILACASGQWLGILASLIGSANQLNKKKVRVAYRFDISCIDVFFWMQNG